MRSEPQHPRQQPEAGIKSVKHNLLPTMKLNYMLWIPVQMVNFLFVPVNVAYHYSVNRSISWLLSMS